jgi:hypothetical protein
MTFYVTSALGVSSGFFRPEKPLKVLANLKNL